MDEEIRTLERAALLGGDVEKQRLAVARNRVEADPAFLFGVKLQEILDKANDDRARAPYQQVQRRAVWHLVRALVENRGSRLSYVVGGSGIVLLRYAIEDGCMTSSNSRTTVALAVRIDRPAPYLPASPARIALAGRSQVCVGIGNCSGSRPSPGCVWKELSPWRPQVSGEAQTHAAKLTHWINAATEDSEDRVCVPIEVAREWAERDRMWGQDQFAR